MKLVSRELEIYKLGFVGVQEVRGDKSGTEPADDCTFLYGNGNATTIFVRKRIISAVKRVAFVSDRMTYKLRGRWCDIIYVTVHAPAKGKCDDKKDRFYEEPEHVFGQCPKCHMNTVRRFRGIGGKGRYI
jgi:hypothetical protein